MKLYWSAKQLFLKQFKNFPPFSLMEIQKLEHRLVFLKKKTRSLVQGDSVVVFQQLKHFILVTWLPDHEVV